MRAGLTEDETARVEAIFTRYVDEDDAMSIIQDLLADGFLIAPNWRVVK